MGLRGATEAQDSLDERLGKLKGPAGTNVNIFNVQEAVLELEKFSQAEYLASLPVSKRSEILSHLKDEQAYDLLHDWPFWARPEQLPPEVWGKDGCFSGTLELVGEQGKPGLEKLVHAILSYAYAGVLNCVMNFIGSINLLA
jgi:hypothetical protein